MKESREHILRIAFGLFLQENFKEVTLKEIVKKTGLSKGAFYHYFKSKEQLFLEVIDHYFSKMIAFDYEQFSKDSLRAFYTDYLDTITAAFPALLEEMKMLAENREQENDLTLNYYLMAFDAMKMFPEFRDKMKEYGLREISSWISAIARARKSGEIACTLSDEQVANLFLFTNDGLGMRLIMGGRLETMREEMQVIWDNLYEMLSTKKQQVQ